MLPSPYKRRLGLRIILCRGHLWVHLRCGPVTRLPSLGWLCQSASDHLVSLLSATQATGLLTPALAGLSPAERASLRLDAHVYEYSTALSGLKLFCNEVGHRLPGPLGLTPHPFNQLRRQSQCHGFVSGSRTTGTGTRTSMTRQNLGANLAANSDRLIGVFGSLFHRTPFPFASSRHRRFAPVHREW